MFHGAKRETVPSRLAEFDVVITTYAIVRRNHDAKTADKENTLFKINWNRVILDEAHQIKNHATQMSKAACALHAKYRWALSGTPVQNALNDLYSLIKFLHCVPFNDFHVWSSQVSKHSKSTMRTKTLVAGLVLRREKTQKDGNGEPIIKLPNKVFTTHTIKLSTFEEKVYKKLQEDGQALLVQEKVGVTAFLVMLLRLRQCCCHLHLLQDSFDPEDVMEDLKQIDIEDCFKMMNIDITKHTNHNVAKPPLSNDETAKYFERDQTSGKIKFVVDELIRLRFDRPDDKVVIISEWTGLLDIMAYHLKKHNFTYAIIKGGITAAKRMDAVEEFNTHPTKPKVMLVSLQAGGVGLNLIGGNHMFLLNSHWNPALEKQAFDRIYRCGQKKEVFIHKFVVKDSIEERMLKLQENKLSIAKSVLDGADATNKIRLTLQDIKLLFNV